jgi:hypothetical protein
MEIRMTTREHLNRLPHPYNELAIANVNPIMLDTKDATVAGAISSNFNWGDSPEGYYFWKAVHQWARHHIDYIPAELPPIPNNNEQ